MTDKKTETKVVPASVEKLVTIFEEQQKEAGEPFTFKDKLTEEFTKYYEDPDNAKLLDEAIKATEGLHGDKANEALVEVITNHGMMNPPVAKFYETLFKSIYK